MNIDDMIWKLNDFTMEYREAISKKDHVVEHTLAYCHLLIIDKCHQQSDPRAAQYELWLSLGHKAPIKNNTFSHWKHWHPETVKFLKSMEEPQYCEASGTEIG